MKEIHIEVVDNGYVLRPESYIRGDQATVRVEEIYVFHTLDQVHVWLANMLEDPKEPHAAREG